MSKAEMTYLGSSGAKLDKITVWLTWKTAKRMGACKRALAYWKDKYDKKDLKITAKCIREFDVTPSGCTAWNTRLNKWTGFDVWGWIDNFIAEYISNPSYLDMSRFLKVVLLYKFKPALLLAIKNGTCRIHGEPVPCAECGGLARLRNAGRIP